MHGEEALQNFEKTLKNIATEIIDLITELEASMYCLHETNRRSLRAIHARLRKLEKSSDICFQENIDGNQKEGSSEEKVYQNETLQNPPN